MPKQAVGYSGPADNESGIYAVARRELAIPFAISFVSKSSDALFSVDTSCQPPRIILRDTEVVWGTIGYVYKVPSATFELVAPDQWLSRVPVIPVAVEEVDPRQYEDWIELKG